MNETIATLHEHGLAHIAALYAITEGQTIWEIGSSSINKKYALACQHVRETMCVHSGISQHNEQSNELLGRLGEQTAVFYFGGHTQSDQGWTRVSVSTYIELLALHIIHFDQDALRQLNEICASFTAAQIPRSGQTRH